MAEEKVRPVIGSYSDPDGESPQEIKVEDKRKKKETPTSSMAEGITANMRKDLKDAEAVQEKVKDYREILKEAEISEQDASVIVDDMLTKGFYEETYKITKKTSVTFRTRAYSDYIKYTRALEVYNPKYVQEQQEIMARYFLAASLVSYKGITFEHPEDKSDESEEARKAFNDRLSWVTAQPQHLVDVLIRTLRKFDHKVQTVMSEGVIENF
jgi:hypothetical protein